MKAMRKRFLATGMGCLAVAMVASDASATRFTETANFFMASFPALSPTPVVGTPPIAAEELKGSSGGGSLFTNTFTLPAQDGSVGVRTVGINQIVQFSEDPNNAFIGSPVLGETVYVIFALEGTANLSNGGALSKFTSGQAIVYSRLGTGFEDDNPSSWGFDPTLANVLAVYDLAAPEDVVKGPNGDLVGTNPGNAIPASEINFSAINTGSPALNQGIFLFDFAGNGPLLATPQFQVNTNPIGDVGTEGLLVFASQQNPTIVDNDPVGDPGFGLFDADATDLAVLNSIFNELLGTDFATGLDFSGGVTDWTPHLTVGDFYNEFNLDANPTSSAAVPEPATMMLGVMGLAGLALRRRRQA